MEEIEKQLKKYVNNLYPAKLSEVHPGQVALDFWKAAFENMENWIRGRRCTGEDVLEYIYKELDGNR